MVEGVSLSCRCGLDAKPRNQVLPTDLPHEAHTQLNEREPIALRLGQFCKLVFGHSWVLYRVNECLCGLLREVYKLL